MQRSVLVWVGLVGLVLAVGCGGGSTGSSTPTGGDSGSGDQGGGAGGDTGGGGTPPLLNSGEVGLFTCVLASSEYSNDCWQGHCWGDWNNTYVHYLIRPERSGEDIVQVLDDPGLHTRHYWYNHDGRLWVGEVPWTTGRAYWRVSQGTGSEGSQYAPRRVSGDTTYTWEYTHSEDATEPGCILSSCKRRTYYFDIIATTPEAPNGMVIQHGVGHEDFADWTGQQEHLGWMREAQGGGDGSLYTASANLVSTTTERGTISFVAFTINQQWHGGELGGFFPQRVGYPVVLPVSYWDSDRDALRVWAEFAVDLAPGGTPDVWVSVHDAQAETLRLYRPPPIPMVSPTTPFATIDLSGLRGGGSVGGSVGGRRLAVHGGHLLCKVADDLLIYVDTAHSESPVPIPLPGNVYSLGVFVER